MRYAGFWIRFWAAAVDGLIFLPLMLVNAGIAATGWNSVSVYVVDLIISFLIGWLYSALFESSGWQATPGKRLMGIHVTDLNGNRISFARATGRHFSKYISGLIFGIGYIMAGITDKKQGLHDKMADTLVLRGKAGEEEFNSAPIQRSSESQENTIFVSESKSGRWVMSGFDDNGHVVRLTFPQDDPRLDQDGLCIGRHAKSCDLHLNDQSISRRHARLFKDQGRIWIEDMRSTNGILVNGRLIPKGGSVELPSQGNITIGAVELSIGKH